MKTREATDDPVRLPSEIWASLEEENKPSDTSAVAEMLKKLMKLKLSKIEDPKKLGERIGMIQGGYTCKVDENQKLAVVVNADTIRQVTMIYDIKNEKMIAERLIKATQKNFRLKGEADSDNKESVRKTALFSGNFPGSCYNCGNQGTKGRIVRRRRKLSLGFDGTMGNAMNAMILGTSRRIVGRKKKTHANGHAIRCPRKIKEKLVLRHLKYWSRKLRQM